MHGKRTYDWVFQSHNGVNRYSIDEKGKGDDHDQRDSNCKNNTNNDDKYNEAGELDDNGSSDSNTFSDESNHLEKDTGIMLRIKRESQQKKMVEQISLQTGKVVDLFDSITAAAAKVGLSHGSISQICNGKKESINGYVFRFVDPADSDNFDENKSTLTGGSAQSNCIEDIKRERNTQQRKVVEQISLDAGKVVRVYDSITAAASKSGISHGSISQICNGKKESINGYVFRFSDQADVHQRQGEEYGAVESHHLRKRAKALKEQERPNASSLWQEVREARLKREQKKMVEQISLQTGKVIDLFDSIAAAAAKVGLSHGSISQICNGKKESINGYVFRFVDPADIHVPDSINQYTKASLQLGISEDEYLMIIKNEEEEAVASLVTLKFLDFI